MKKELVFSLAAMAVGVAQAQMSVGVEGGSARTSLGAATADIDSFYEDLFQSPATASYDKSVATFRIFGGMAVNAKTNVEGGYVNFGDANINVQTNFFGINIAQQATIANSGFDVSALYQPFDNGFYVKGGLHATKSEFDVKTYVAGSLDSVVSGSESGVGLLYGLGYQAAVAEGLNVRASIVRYQNLGGESESKMDLISLGVSKSF
jgi:hypothetical protein